MAVRLLIGFFVSYVATGQSIAADYNFKISPMWRIVFDDQLPESYPVAELPNLKIGRLYPAEAIEIGSDLSIPREGSSSAELRNAGTVFAKMSSNAGSIYCSWRNLSDEVFDQHAAALNSDIVCAYDSDLNDDLDKYFIISSKFPLIFQLNNGGLLQEPRVLEHAVPFKRVEPSRYPYPIEVRVKIAMAANGKLRMQECRSQIWIVPFDGVFHASGIPQPGCGNGQLNNILGMNLRIMNDERGVRRVYFNKSKLNRAIALEF